MEDAELRLQLHQTADTTERVDPDHAVTVRGQRRKEHSRLVYPINADAGLCHRAIFRCLQILRPNKLKNTADPD